MQYNYGLCDKPVCEYCDLVRASTAGAVEPPTAATAKDLKAGLDDLENKLQTASLQEIGERADGDYNLSKNLGTRIDAAVSGLVHGVSVDGIVKDKKATDADGAVYIVDPAPTGTFAGHANQVASLSGGTWHFQAPAAQETHLNESDNQMWTWNGTAWVKVGSVGTSEKVNDAIHKAPAKATPADNDELALADSATTPTPFGLAKLTWGKLKENVFSGFSAWVHGLTELADVPGGDFPDAQEYALRGADGIAYKVSLGTLKAVWATVFPRFQAGHTPTIGNLLRYTSTGWDSVSTAALRLIQFKDGQTFHNEEMLQYEAASSQWVGIDKVDVVKDAVKSAPGNSNVADSDIFVTTMAADGAVRKTTGAQLKGYIGAGDIVRKYINVDNGGADAAMFDISTLPNNTPSYIEIKGFASALGADASEAVLKITTTAGVKNVETLFNNAKRTGTWGSGGSQTDGGFNDGHFYLNLNAGSASTQVKGNCVATWQIRLYKQSNGWVMLEWQGLYEGSSGGTQIFCAGNASAALSEKITHIGIAFVDGVSTHGARNILADMVLEAHP